jgi:hypothetical protein
VDVGKELNCQRLSAFTGDESFQESDATSYTHACLRSDEQLPCFLSSVLSPSTWYVLQLFIRHFGQQMWPLVDKICLGPGRKSV